ATLTGPSVDADLRLCLFSRLGISINISINISVRFGFGFSFSFSVRLSVRLDSSACITASAPPPPPSPLARGFAFHIAHRPQASAAAAAPPPLPLSSVSGSSATVALPLALATLQPDPYSPLNTPFDDRYPPLVIGPQSTAFWSTYRSQIDLQPEWPQHDPGNISVVAARAFGLNLALDNHRSAPDFSLSSLAPFTSQPPLLQSPPQPPQRLRPDLHLAFDFGFFPAPVSASASAPTSAPSLSAAAPSAPSPGHPHPSQNQNRPDTNRILFGTSSPASTLPLASPPASGQASAPLQTSADAFLDSDVGAPDGIFDDVERVPDLPPPIAETADSSFASAADTTMPAASTARRRSLRSQAAAHEARGGSTSTTNTNKRQRLTVASAAEPTPLRPAMDDDDSLFGSSPSRPGSTLGFKSEDYTTIDLTDATDVPDELKKPQVDNRVKLSTFQCVICMDDVTGLTLTHCGHLFCAQCLYSSLSIESTRGKCPMCRAKIDMKPRDNYSTKTKGYWPLELKLMTRTRQGKRKAQAMA
ncbi:six8, partial [Trichoderma cornu-damae]